MTIVLRKPAGTRDWGATVWSLALAALEGLANPANVARELKAASEATRDLPLDERAWVWLRVSLAAALYDLARRDRARVQVNEAELKAAIREHAEAMAAEAEGVALTRQMLWNPGDAPELAPVFARAPFFWRAVAPEATEAASGAANAVRRALRPAAARVAVRDPAFHQPLEDALKGAFGLAGERERAWRRHEEWVLRLYERTPIFSPDESESATLRDVYQRLRCFWHVVEKRETDDRRESAERQADRIHAHVGDLHDEMAAWLARSEAKDDFRIVTGGPGSGKSSFARAFSVEAATVSDFRVAFIELQHMTLTADLEDGIGRYFRNRHIDIDDKGSPGLPESPLDWRKDQDQPLLLIFDGLDELSVRERDNAEEAQRFIQSVHNLLEKLNPFGPRVKAVVLGRSVACQEGLRRARLSPSIMLHVMPLIPWQDRTDFGLPANATEEKKELHDPHGLSEADQRDEYWARWAALKGLPAKPPPKVHSERLKTLSAEPLLLHLLLISRLPDEAMEENPNRVYADIFATIHDRNQCVPGRERLDDDDFDILMECLALAAWRGGGRTTEEADFLKLRKAHAGPRRDKRFREMPSAELRNVAVQFHAKKDFEGGEGFEFIHKSFSDFLVARAVMRLADWSSRELSDEERDTDEATVAAKWVDVVGDAEWTREINDFLIDEARLCADPEARIDLLTLLFNWTLRHGMPAHVGAEDYRSAETRQRCAETALLAALSALGRSCGWSVEGKGRLAPVSFAWPDVQSPRRLFARLRVGEVVAARLAFAAIDLSDVDLSEANLRSVNLSGANLSEADLLGATARGANLSEANLSGANMGAINLIAANLREANLFQAHLSDANLFGANLSGADLTEADLAGASLFGARLREANLTGVNWSFVTIDAASLHSADLSGAEDLTQEQVNAARGDGDTKLPPGLTRPAHWDD